MFLENLPQQQEEGGEEGDADASSNEQWHKSKLVTTTAVVGTALAEAVLRVKPGVAQGTARGSRGIALTAAGIPDLRIPAEAPGHFGGCTLVHLW